MTQKSTWQCAHDFLDMAAKLQVASTDTETRNPDLSKRLERLCDRFLTLATQDLESALKNADSAFRSH